MNNKKVKFTLIMPAIIIVSLIAALIVKSFVAYPVSEIGGQYGNGEYINNYFEIKYTFPDRFAYEDYGTIASENKEFKGFEEVNSYPYKKAEKYTLYQDSCIINPLFATRIETCFVPKSQNRISKGKLLKELIKETEKNENCKLSKKSKKEIANRKFNAAELKSKEKDNDNKYIILISEKDNSYLIIKLRISAYDEKTPDDYYEFFSEIE